MKIIYRFFFASVLLLIQLSLSAQIDSVFSNDNIEVIYPDIIVKTVEQEIQIKITDKEIARQIEGKEVTVDFNQHKIKRRVLDGSIIILYDFPEKEMITISIGETIHTQNTNPIPLWLSILPPLIAISGSW